MTDRTSARLERHAAAVVDHEAALAASRRTFQGRTGPVDRPAGMTSSFASLSGLPEHAEWRRLAEAHREAVTARSAHAATRETAEALDEDARAHAVTADPSAPLPPAEHVPAHEAAALEHDQRVAALERVEIDAFLAFVRSVRDRADVLKREHLDAAAEHRTRLDELLAEAAAAVAAIDRAEDAAGVVRSMVKKDVNDRRFGTPTVGTRASVEVTVLPARLMGHTAHLAPATLLEALRDYRATPTEPTPDPFELVIEPNDRPDVSGPRRRAARIGIRRATSTEADAA